MNRLAIVFALVLSALPRVARAADPIVVSSSEDTAAYRFLPDLARGDDAALYAFTINFLGQPHDFRTFLHFSPMPSLTGACVESAEVYVYYGFEFSGFGPGGTAPGTLTCSPVLAPWSAATMTWNNQPPIGAASGVITGITAFGFLACDVTTTVQAWANGAPDYGIALSSPTDRVMGFYSAYETQVNPVFRPALAITLSDDPLACPEPGAIGAVVVAMLALARLRAGRRR